jgi:NPCBM/NEW2 domain
MLEGGGALRGLPKSSLGVGQLSLTDRVHEWYLAGHRRAMSGDSSRARLLDGLRCSHVHKSGCAARCGIWFEIDPEERRRFRAEHNKAWSEVVAVSAEILRKKLGAGSRTLGGFGISVFKALGYAIQPTFSVVLYDRGVGRDIKLVILGLAISGALVWSGANDWRPLRRDTRASAASTSVRGTQESTLQATPEAPVPVAAAPVADVTTLTTTRAASTTVATTTTTTLLATATAPPPADTNLTSLPIVKSDDTFTHNPVTVDGVRYSNVIRTWAAGTVEFNLKESYASFTATVGFNDASDCTGSWLFAVYSIDQGTYKELAKAELRIGQTQRLQAPVAGVRRFMLAVGNADDNSIRKCSSTNDPFVWADPILHA